jgi:hypothetical protein
MRRNCKVCGGFPVLARTMCQWTKSRAKRRGIPFDITAEDILELIGDGVCPVLGIPYDLTLHKVNDASASLDKFVPALGYVKGNCFVMSMLANAIKRNTSSEQVLKVGHWMEQQEKKKGIHVVEEAA